MLIEKEYISEVTPLHFFDDDSDNIDQVSDLDINITSNLVDGHNNNIFTVTYTEVHHTQSIITEENSKNRKGSLSEKKISKRQKDDNATNGQKKENIEEERRKDEEKTQTNEITNNTKSKSTSLNDDDDDNPGIFRHLIFGGLAAVTAAAGAISLMK